MARSIATSDNLRELSRLFNEQNNRIQGLERDLQRRLDELQWTDPVGINFRQKYEELKDKINHTLCQALQNYSQYLNQQASNVDQFNEGLL